MIPLRDNIPSRKFPIVTYALLAANVLLFIFQIQLVASGFLENFIAHYAVIPKLIASETIDHLYTLVTSQFLHGGWAHIIGNMVYLYIFGDNVEDKFGHGRYLFFYILSGCGAALTQIYFNPQSEIPMIGASGAIAGVLGAYFLLYPKAKVLTLIPLGFFSRIVEVPSFFFLGFWFIMQTFSGTAAFYTAKAIGSDVGGVAWFAHAGGFIVGALFAFPYLFKKRR